MKILFISLAVVLTDQLSKIYIKGLSLPYLNIKLDGVMPGVQYSIIEDFLNITLVENPGIAFGIDPGADLKPFLTVLTFLITLGLLYFFYKSREDRFIKRTALALLIGGAVGNLIDRFFYGIIYGTGTFLNGNVVDFVNIRINDFMLFEQMIGNYVFNIADIAVSIGLLLMIISIQTAPQHDTEKLAAENQE